MAPRATKRNRSQEWFGDQRGAQLDARHIVRPVRRPAGYRHLQHLVGAHPLQLAFPRLGPVCSRRRAGGWRPNAKSSMSLGVRAGSARSDSGRLIPFSALSFAVPPVTPVISTRNRSSATSRMTPRDLPSSNRIGSLKLPGETPQHRHPCERRGGPLRVEPLPSVRGNSSCMRRWRSPSSRE
jgi:hypothetical protein